MLALVDRGGLLALLVWGGVGLLLFALLRGLFWLFFFALLATVRGGTSFLELFAGARDSVLFGRG
ncbi:hypothetical protein AXG89_01795 [Burkholderia sp. PAMC 26561]|nr:hypothetical protein AXG89_01795 [Burkholderia sp. PAMC 26561]